MNFINFDILSLQQLFFSLIFGLILALFLLWRRSNTKEEIDKEKKSNEEINNGLEEEDSSNGEDGLKRAIVEDQDDSTPKTEDLDEQMVVSEQLSQIHSLLKECGGEMSLQDVQRQLRMYRK